MTVLSFFRFHSPFPVPTPPLISHTFMFLQTHKSRKLGEFSSVMNKSGVFICESFLWSLSWLGGARGLAAPLGFLWAFSQRRPRHDYCYSEREAGSGTVKRGVWSGHGRNGTASTFHTSLGVTANFLYCTFDWKHIWNIFSWSHLPRRKERKVKKKRESSKNEVQNMTKCTELTLDLTNGYIFFIFFLIFYFSNLE